MSKIIVHNLDEYLNIDLLLNENLKVILYNNHNKNPEFGDNYIKSCSPKKYYIGEYIEKTNQFKLFSRNNFVKEYNSFTYIKDDKRITEKNKIIGYFYNKYNHTLLPILNINNVYFFTILDYTKGELCFDYKFNEYNNIFLIDKNNKNLQKDLYNFLIKFKLISSSENNIKCNLCTFNLESKNKCNHFFNCYYNYDYIYTKK